MRWNTSLRRGVLGCWIGVALLISGTAPAEAELPTGECRSGWWSGNRNLDSVAGVGMAACLLQWQATLADPLSVGFRVHTGWADAGRAQHASGEVEEAWIETVAGALSARLGRQLIAWGRADRINPTDVFGPRDHTRLIPEDEGQRLGVDALQLRYAVSDALQWVAVVAATAGDRYPMGSLPPQRSVAAPDRGPSWAIRLDHRGNVDWALIYYDGRRLTLLDRVSVHPQRGVQFEAEQERTQIWGLDFATSVEAFTVRGELAVSRLRSACGNCSDAFREQTQVVFGVDHDVGDNGNLNVQWFATWQRGSEQPAGQLPALRDALARLNRTFDRHQQGLSLRLAQRLFNDRLKAELTLLYDLSLYSRLLRPRLSYALDDQWKLSIGADEFRGPKQSLFGSLRQNSTVFVELAWAF